MPAYCFARAEVLNPTANRKVTGRIASILPKHGGNVLPHGALYETLEGPEGLQRIALLRLESLDVARRCFESPEYVEAALDAGDAA